MCVHILTLAVKKTTFLRNSSFFSYIYVLANCGY